MLELIWHPSQDHLGYYDTSTLYLQTRKFYKTVQFLVYEIIQTHHNACDLAIVHVDGPVTFT